MGMRKRSTRREVVRGLRATASSRGGIRALGGSIASRVVAAAILGAVAASFCVELRAETPPFGPPIHDPAKIVGADQCAKCHAQEVQQWMRTPHFATFDNLHRTPEAKQIAERLGLRSIKRNDMCLECHYTTQDQGGRVRVVSGVSCESCHGAASDWLAIHADYGVGATKETETAEHRQSRLAESIALGMNNPHNVYRIAKQCYDCHTVPNERLVNVGGHAAGSDDFELVSWSQGIVRHNFLRTEGRENAALTPSELRVMYVVGVMADLEYSLRAAAIATERAEYGQKVAARAARMKRRLREIEQRVPHPLIQAALDAVSTVELKLNNQAELEAAADRISQAAYEFAATVDGGTLPAIDDLLPTVDQYKN